MKTILVTGATGFLGGAVARDLHERGYNVRATGRNLAAGQRLSAAGIAFIPCDLAASASAVANLLQGCDAVAHCAALASPWGLMRDFHAANVVATQHIIDACQQHRIARLVHISSPSVLFDFADQHDLKEHEPWTTPPANFYIATKRQGERLVLDACHDTALPAIVLRPQAMFGPGDTTLMPRILRVARRGFFPRFRREPTLLDLAWVGDAAQAVRLALEASPELHGHLYSITSGDPQPFSAILATIFKSHALRVRFIALPFAIARPLATAFECASRCLTASRWEPPITRYSVGAVTFSQTLDISAAKQDLGYRPSGAVLEKLAATCAL